MGFRWSRRRGRSATKSVYRRKSGLRCRHNFVRDPLGETETGGFCKPLFGFFRLAFDSEQDSDVVIGERTLAVDLDCPVEMNARAIKLPQIDFRGAEIIQSQYGWISGIRARTKPDE